MSETPLSFLQQPIQQPSFDISLINQESVKDIVENADTIDLKMIDIDPGEKFGYPEDDLTNNVDDTLGLEDEVLIEGLNSLRDISKFSCLSQNHFNFFKKSYLKILDVLLPHELSLLIVR